MIDQEARDVAAGVEHLMTQRGKDARNWQAQSEQHEATLIELRGKLDDIQSGMNDVNAVLDSADIPSAHHVACNDPACRTKTGHRVRALSQQNRELVEALAILRLDHDALKALAQGVEQSVCVLSSGGTLVSAPALDALRAWLERRQG